MITKNQILEVAVKQGWVKREQFYSFSLHDNPVYKGQYAFARLKKQKSKELKRLNRLFQELVLGGFLYAPNCDGEVRRHNGFKIWILRPKKKQNSC